MQQLGALGFLLSQHANELAVENDEHDERHEEHDDEVEEVGVDDAVDGLVQERRRTRHEHGRQRRPVAFDHFHLTTDHATSRQRIRVVAVGGLAQR